MDHERKWVMAPVKPTAQMDQAGADYIFEDGINHEARCDAATHVYAAMLAAAPPAPAGSEGWRDDQIDSAAKHLRDTLQAGKRLTPWADTPRATKRKWLILAASTLAAAAPQEQSDAG